MVRNQSDRMRAAAPRRCGCGRPATESIETLLGRGLAILVIPVCSEHTPPDDHTRRWMLKTVIEAIGDAVLINRGAPK